MKTTTESSAVQKSASHQPQENPMPTSPATPAHVSLNESEATTRPASVASTRTMFINPPPDISSITIPPHDYVAPTPGEFRSVAPRKSELAALPQAVIDAKNFTEYSQMIGGNGPSLDHIVQTYDLARQWSMTRQASAKWDAYCALQEGLAWQALRGVNVHLSPAYSLALVLNPELPSRLPGLTSLLQAKKTISKKGASTRKLNEADKAMGLPPSHGLIGRRNQRRAEKEALAAQKAAVAAGKVNAGAQSTAATPEASATTAPGAPGVDGTRARA